MQIRNGLGSTARLQLLHDQIRLDSQQQRLAWVSTTGGRPLLQSLRLQQGLRADLVLTRFEAALCSGLKGSQGQGLGRRGRHAEGKQDCDGARDQSSRGRFTEMMP